MKLKVKLKPHQRKSPEGLAPLAMGRFGGGEEPPSKVFALDLLAGGRL